MNLRGELFVVIDALREAELDYALCGGLAVAVHGYPRATKDIDILIREADLERARKCLEAAGYTLETGLIPFDIGKPTERRVFRVTKIEGSEFMTVDMILVSGFLEEVWSDREKHDLEGSELGVVSLKGLRTMKRVAGRPQDLADLAQLGSEGDV